MWMKWLNTPTLEGVAHASSPHVPDSKLAFREGFSISIWYGNNGIGSLVCGCQEFSQHQYWGESGHPIKSMCGLALPFHGPKAMSLQLLVWREIVLSFYHGQSFPTSITSMINTSATTVPMLTPSHPWSLYIKLFTLNPTGMLWKMSKGQHKASCSPNLEESQLSVIGLVADISHFVVLPQSYSYLELVPLRQWWYTMPT